MTPLWTDRQFWLDASWRSLRTFCQTLAGCLTAWTALVIIPALQNPTAEIDLGRVTGGPKMWALFLFASAVAAFVSLLQAIDRGREAAKVVAATAATVSAATPAIVPAPLPELAVPTVTPMASAPTDAIATFCGDTTR